jgi:flagellar biosynthesis/type III secretory pathway protein FliH
LQRAEAAHKAALAKARSDAETEIRAAQARGREEGLSEGEAKAGDRYRRSLEELRRNADVALDLLSREKASLFLEFEGQALELVSAVIHRVFEGFAQRESEAVLPLLRKAVAALGQSNAITLKVNPADFKTASDNQDFWLPVETARKDVRVLADERIPPGGCFVESDSTSVGLRADELAERVDEELKRVFAAKAQALRNESGEGMGPGDGPDAGAGDDAMPGPPAGG